MTGPELIAKAEAMNVNPYYLGYALETGAATPAEAFKRDGHNALYVEWNEARWLEQAKAEGRSREWVSSTPGNFERHCALIAARLDRHD